MAVASPNGMRGMHGMRGMRGMREPQTGRRVGGIDSVIWRTLWAWSSRGAVKKHSELEFGAGIFIGHLSHKCHNYIYIYIYISYNYHNSRVVIYWTFPVESTDFEFTLFTLAFSISSKRGRMEVPCIPSRREAKT